MSRWMLFVDGENFTIRGQDFARKTGLELVAGTYWQADVYLWFPECGAGPFYGLHPERPMVEPLRAHYYTTAVGDQNALDLVREKVWSLRFSPSVFKKDSRTKRTKGVDITLATDMLSGAYKGIYDTAVLVAGDADYVPLVEEVRRQGRRVVVMFYGPTNGLSTELRLSADSFTDLENWTKRRWRHYVNLVREGKVQDGIIAIPSTEQHKTSNRGGPPPVGSSAAPDAPKND